MSYPKCEDCAFYEPSSVGVDLDKCKHPKSDRGCLVRHLPAYCHKLRDRARLCGTRGKWFEPKKETVECG